MNNGYNICNFILEVSYCGNVICS